MNSQQYDENMRNNIKFDIYREFDRTDVEDFYQNSTHEFDFKQLLQEISRYKIFQQNKLLENEKYLKGSQIQMITVPKLITKEQDQSQGQIKSEIDIIFLQIDQQLNITKSLKQEIEANEKFIVVLFLKIIFQSKTMSQNETLRKQLQICEINLEKASKESTFFHQNLNDVKLLQYRSISDLTSISRQQDNYLEIKTTQQDVIQRENSIKEEDLIQFRIQKIKMEGIVKQQAMDISQIDKEIQMQNQNRQHQYLAVYQLNCLRALYEVFFNNDPDQLLTMNLGQNIETIKETETKMNEQKQIPNFFKTQISDSTSSNLYTNTHLRKIYHDENALAKISLILEVNRDNFTKAYHYFTYSLNIGIEQIVNILLIEFNNMMKNLQSATNIYNTLLSQKNILKQQILESNKIIETLQKNNTKIIIHLEKDEDLSGLIPNQFKIQDNFGRQELTINLAKSTNEIKAILEKAEEKLKKSQSQVAHFYVFSLNYFARLCYSIRLIYKFYDKVPVPIMKVVTEAENSYFSKTLNEIFKDSQLQSPINNLQNLLPFNNMSPVKLEEFFKQSGGDSPMTRVFRRSTRQLKTLLRQVAYQPKKHFKKKQSFDLDPYFSQTSKTLNLSKIKQILDEFFYYYLSDSVNVLFQDKRLIKQWISNISDTFKQQELREDDLLGLLEEKFPELLNELNSKKEGQIKQGLDYMARVYKLIKNEIRNFKYSWQDEPVNVNLKFEKSKFITKSYNQQAQRVRNFYEQKTSDDQNQIEYLKNQLQSQELLSEQERSKRSGSDMLAKTLQDLNINEEDVFYQINIMYRD